MTPKLSVCIPTFDINNGRANTLIDSIFSSTKDLSFFDLEIIVEDCKGQLRGWTEPMNKAVSKATAHNLLIVNDDVQMSPGWFVPMIAALNRGAWCVTPDATHTDGPQIFHPWCMLWDKKAWNTIGGLDERFFFWGSDIDIAHRLVDAGHPPVKVKLPNPVTHQLNATAEEHPELGAICMGDLQKFKEKWGVDAEYEKHRLAALKF